MTHGDAGPQGWNSLKTHLILPSLHMEQTFWFLHSLSSYPHAPPHSGALSLSPKALRWPRVPHAMFTPFFCCVLNTESSCHSAYHSSTEPTNADTRAPLLGMGPWSVKAMKGEGPAWCLPCSYSSSLLEVLGFKSGFPLQRFFSFDLKIQYLLEF